MSIPSPDGTREVAVPYLICHKASLSDEQVQQMAQLALTLEATMGYAVDIECALAGEKLHLLQCRPITRLNQSNPAAG